MSANTPDDVYKQLIREIVDVIRPLVTKWNAESGFEKAVRDKKWKHVFKQIFVHLTQLATGDPAKQKKMWRQDLEKAANQTIVAICPEWATKPTDKCISEQIQNAANRKTNPRPEWLRERAHTWLQSMSPELQKSS